MTFDNRVGTGPRQSVEAGASASELARAGERWNRVFIRCYLPYLAFGAFLAASIPATGIAPIDPLVSIVAEWVPSIDRLARFSPLPGMTRTFGALMWLVYPIFTVGAMLWSPRFPRRSHSWTALLFVLPSGAVCLLVFGVLLPFFFPEVTRELGYTHGRGVAGLTFIISSRFGHGTLGALIFVFSSISVVVMWRFLRDYPGLVLFNIRYRLQRRAFHG